MRPDLEMFLYGLLVGGLLMAAVIFCLLILGFDRKRKELQVAEEKGYQDGYQRGWDERSQCLRDSNRALASAPTSQEGGER